MTDELIAEIRGLSAYQQRLLRAILREWRELPPEVWAGSLVPGGPQKHPQEIHARPIPAVDSRQPGPSR